MTSYFIDGTGALFGCGTNVYGQLGIDTGETSSLDIFKRIDDGEFISISCSNYHIMAIDKDRYLWCCGRDNFGQLGLGDFIENIFRNKLNKNPFDQKILMITCGQYHTIAIDINGHLWGCGSNTSGELGLGNVVFRDKFVPIPTDRRFSMVSCKSNISFAIDEDGGLWACGHNYYGQLGLGDHENRNTFQKVPTDDKFIMVSCGSWHTMAIDENGNLWACGDNFAGQLGFGDNYGRNKLEKVPIENRFIMISCGSEYTMAIDEDGFLWACGSNRFGQLGLCDNHIMDKTNKLEKHPLDKRFTMVSCGNGHTLAVDIEGYLWVCGNNRSGQLGLGDPDKKDMRELLKIGNINNVQTLMNNCAIKKRGSNTKGAHKNLVLSYDIN